MGFNLTTEGRAAVSGLVGIGTGGLQLIVTRAIDVKSALGANAISGITNGQVVNLGTGLLFTILGFIGVLGKGGALGRHPSFSGWLLAHGFTCLIGGVAVPLIAAAATGTSNSFAATVGAYPPPQRSNPISGNSPLATRRNADLVRALRG
jgi:hypothetical protein